MVPQGPSPSNAQPSQSVAVPHGRAAAEATPAIAGALAELLAHDVARWGEHGMTLVKQRSVRTVWSGALGGVPVHVKVYRADRLADRARDALRGPRGARELTHLRVAADLGLPAAEPLASGLAVAGDDLCSFVVTRTVPDAQPFTFALPPATITAVGRLLRAMHDRGALAGDLHVGNLLVDGGGRPTLIDLASLRHRGEPTLAERARGLAFFCQELDGGALDPRARGLLAGYLADGTALGDALRRELALATHRWRARALPAFGRRSTRTCRHTEVAPHRRGQWHWHWHLPTADADVRARATAFVAAPPAPHKTGRRGSVWLTDWAAVKERQAGAARKLWRAAYWLRFAGVPSPMPLAFAAHAGRGFVFSERLAAEPLAGELAAGRLAAPAIAAAARSLGDSVGRLHAHGLGNRDLKFDNLIRDPATGRVAMVDLDGIRRSAAADTRGRGADLGRLLAAFRAAGEPGGDATVRTFLRAWLRAQRRLLRSPPLRRIVRRAAVRAGEWARDHGAVHDA